MSVQRTAPLRRLNQSPLRFSCTPYTTIATFLIHARREVFVWLVEVLGLQQDGDSLEVGGSTVVLHQRSLVLLDPVGSVTLCFTNLLVVLALHLHGHREPLQALLFLIWLRLRQSRCVYCMSSYRMNTSTDAINSK